MLASATEPEVTEMSKKEQAMRDFEAAWSRWHRAQAELNPHFVAGEAPPEEKLDDLEQAVEQLEEAKERLDDAIRQDGLV